MKDKKFLTLLASLDKQELTAFGKYLRDRHGNEEVTLSVFAYIRKFYPDFEDEKKLELGFAYKKIFEEDIDAQPYNRTKMLNALSDLFLWLKEFLLLEEAMKDSPESRVLWLKVLKQRKQEREFWRLAMRFKAEQEAAPKKSVMDFIKGMASGHFFYFQSLEDRATPDVEALQRFRLDLNRYYAISKYKLACETANLNKMLSANLEPLQSERLPVLEETGTPGEHPLLLLYRKLYEVVTLGGEDKFDEMVAQMAAHAPRIDRPELYVMVGYLHNYAAAQLRKGKEDYLKRAHELNKFCLQYDIFSMQNVMSTTQFNNVVSFACGVKDFDWALSFVKTQSRLLQPEIAGDTVLLSMGIIHFIQKNFNEVLRLLEGKNLNEVNDTVHSRTMILRCYYELNKDPEKVVDFCTALESYSRRHWKPKGEAYEAMANSLKIMKMLIRKKVSKERVLQDINGTPLLFFKDWLLEKAVVYSPAVYKPELAAHQRNR